MTVLLAFLSLKFWNTCAQNPRRILNARKNTRFNEIILAKKILALFLHFPHVKKHRTFNAFFLYSHFFAKWAKNSKFFCIIFKKYSRGFTRIWTIYSQGFLLAQFYIPTCSRFFLAFFCFLLTLLFLALFFLAFFSSHARKKRICEGKKKPLGGGAETVCLDPSYFISW